MGSKYSEGRAAGLVYGRRGFGVTGEQAAARGDDYLAGYEDGYAAAWSEPTTTGEVVSERRMARLDVALAGDVVNLTDDARFYVEVALYGTTMDGDAYAWSIIRLSHDDAERFADAIVDTRGAVHAFRDADLSSRTISVLRGLAPHAGSDRVGMHTVVQVQDDRDGARRVTGYILPNIATARDTAREVRAAITSNNDTREG